MDQVEKEMKQNQACEGSSKVFIFIIIILFRSEN